MEVILLLVLLGILLLWLISAEGRAGRLAEENEQLQEQLSFVVNIVQQNDQNRNSGCASALGWALLVLVAGGLLVIML